MHEGMTMYWLNELEKGLDKMKKIVSIILTFLLLFSHAFATSDALIFLSDGYIKIEGVIPVGRQGDPVTITIIEGNVEWMDESDLHNVNPEIIAYYNEGAFDKGGKYSFEFSLKKNGYYKVYIGADALKEPLRYDLYYINEDKYQMAVNELLSAANNETVTNEMLGNVLKSNSENLGLFSRAVVEADITEVAQLIRMQLKDKEEKDITFDSLIKQVSKAAMISLLNHGMINDIKDYIDSLYMSAREQEFFNDIVASDFCNRLSNKNITDIETFESMIIDSLIMATVNSSVGTGKIQSLLNTYYEEIGITKTMITDSVCKAISERKNFSDINSLRSFIESYTSSSPVNGGGPSPGGGGGVQKKNSFTGTQSIIPPLEVNSKDISVFDDIDSVEWAKEAIINLYYEGVLSGKAQNLFYPNDHVKREEFVKMLILAFKINLIGDDIPFTDVSPDAWYYSFVQKAYSAGITKGINNNEFGVGRNITRQDLCVMIYQTLKAGDYTLKAGQPIEFKDKASIADYALEAVDLLSAAGIVNGTGDGYFNPDMYATRAEAAKIIYHTINQIK